MYADQHVHTSFSGDSDTPMEEQIAKAISLNMENICITDHHDYDMVSDVDFNLDIPAYLAAVSEMREKFAGKINIMTGIELGLQEHIANHLNNLTNEYSFDFIIGSIHCIDGLDPFFPEYFKKYREKGYDRYFEAMLGNLKKYDCFDSLGHLDYIVRYGERDGYRFSYEKYAGCIDEILKIVIDKGKALECNCGGYASLDRPNPGKDVFLRYRELGGELVTIGSDAHSPDKLGYAFDRAGQLLKDCGFGYYFVYKNRVPAAFELSK